MTPPIPTAWREKPGLTGRFRACEVYPHRTETFLQGDNQL
jgi:hypothetical protein